MHEVSAPTCLTISTPITVVPPPMGSAALSLWPMDCRKVPDAITMAMSAPLGMSVLLELVSSTLPLETEHPSEACETPAKAG